MKNTLLSLVALIAFSSCWKEETPIEAKQRLGNSTTTIAMGSSYDQVVWYNIEDQSIFTQPKDAWELMLNREGDNVVALLNTGMFSQVAKAPTLDWSEQIDEEALVFTTDYPSLVRDSLAIGTRFGEGDIWIINRGFNTLGEALPLIKVQCMNIDESTISIKYGLIENDSFQLINVSLPSESRGVGVRFSDGAILQVTPEEWDLCFTQYIHIFHEPYTPYLVTGVLTNTIDGSLSQETALSFEGIISSSLDGMLFGLEANNIGYDWKFYDLDAGQYTVDPSRVYLVKTNEDRLFKIRFLDFYNESGERGYPSFEIEEVG
jgi:HmuY protein